LRFWYSRNSDLLNVFHGKRAIPRTTGQSGGWFTFYNKPSINAEIMAAYGDAGGSLSVRYGYAHGHHPLVAVYVDYIFSDLSGDLSPPK